MVAKSSSRKLKEVEKKLEEARGILANLERTSHLDPAYFSAQWDRQKKIQSETLGKNVVNLRIKLGKLIEQEESLNLAK